MFSRNALHSCLNRFGRNALFLQGFALLFASCTEPNPEFDPLRGDPVRTRDAALVDVSTSPDSGATDAAVKDSTPDFATFLDAMADAEPADSGAPCDGCRVNGECYAAGQSPTACGQCLPQFSRTELTFVAGRPCEADGLTAGFCAAGSCRGWAHDTYRPDHPQLFATSLSSVAAVRANPGQDPPQWEVWAGSEYNTIPAGALGTLIRLDDPSAEREEHATHGTVVAVDHRFALDGAGSLWRFDEGTWQSIAKEQPALRLRSGMWASTLGANEASEVVYISGLALANLASLIRCKIDHGKLANCEAVSESGLPQSCGFLNSVFGFASTDSSLELWATVNGTCLPTAHQGNHVLSRDTSGADATWTTDPPGGCRDRGQGSTPCSRTFGNLQDIHGSSPANLWIVGEAGIVLHHDSSGWHRLQIPGQSASESGEEAQHSFHFDAVFTSQQHHLTTIVGHRELVVDDTKTVEVGTFHYNHQLDRWFGPQQIWAVEFDRRLRDPLRIRDIGGVDYPNLWMVGHGIARLPSGGSAGWILSLK